MLELDILKTEAENLGFCLAGIADPAADLRFDAFTGWINAGHHAGQSYLARLDTLAKRERPLLLHEQTSAIIVLAAAYPLLHACKAGEASISNYACGSDYHDTLSAGCHQLFERLSRLGQVIGSYRICVDSSPVLERSLAVSAGLGWIGKNGMLIHPKYGSALLLCEIFIESAAEIPQQAPMPDRCGTCQRCLTACPTACILPNRTLDCSRCLSYLTIEHKSDLPANMKPLLSGNAFGCDICQLVCPWNKKNSDKQPQSLFAAMPELHCLDAHEAVRQSEAEFREKYQGTPVLRAKHRGFTRNLRALLES